MQLVSTNAIIDEKNTNKSDVWDKGGRDKDSLPKMMDPFNGLMLAGSAGSNEKKWVDTVFGQGNEMELKQECMGIIILLKSFF